MKEYGWVSINEFWQKIHISNLNKKQHRIVLDDLGRKLIPRQGNIKIWHFALHKDETQYQCDDKDYKCNKGEWHKDWQSYSPSSHVEVYKKKDNNTCHIADMIDRSGNVFEFQASPIGIEDIETREQTYINMCWVVDATGSNFIQLEDGRVVIKELESWWSLFTKDVFFDIGKGLAYLNQRYYLSKDDMGYICVKYYLCTFFTYETFITGYFVLKQPFNLLSKHRDKDISNKPKHSFVMDDNKLTITLTNNKSLFINFGFENKRLEVYNSKELADQIEQLRKEKIRQELLERIRQEEQELLERIRQEEQKQLERIKQEKIRQESLEIIRQKEKEWLEKIRQEKHEQSGKNKRDRKQPEIKPEKLYISNTRYTPELFDQIVDFAFKKSGGIMSEKEIADAIRKLGYLEIFKEYKIPSKEVTVHLKKLGIMGNIKFKRIISKYDK